MGDDAMEAVSHVLRSMDLYKDGKRSSRDGEIVRYAVTAVKSFVQDEAKSRPRDVALESIVKSLVEEKGESGAQEFILNAMRPFLRDKRGNSRGSEVVLNEVPGVVDSSKEGKMEGSFVRSVSRKEKEIALSSESSDDGDESDDSTDDESAGEPEEIDTTLNSNDAALYAEVIKVIREGGDLKKLKVDHLKAYLRHHGLRMSGLKAVLLSRLEDHLRLKDGRAEELYPRSSFSINCKGDVCLGDTVLFLQNVYDSFAIVSRSGKPLGKRWVAGRVVNESYGAGKQQHTFTIEVLWSTGPRPFYVMRPLQIKGRNLYRIHTMRQPWVKESDRQKVLEEKHARGAEARGKRAAVKATRAMKAGSKHACGAETRPQRRADSIVTRTRDHLAESNRILPTIPHFQNSMQHVRPRMEQQGRAHIEQHARARIEQYARAHTNQQHGKDHIEQYAGARTEQHGMPHTQSHGYRGSTGAQGSVVQEMICSNHGCDNAGAKHCISRSCASCCSRNASTRGSCPRHK